MGRDSSISWTHSTFNPIRGCTRISAGCAHCYAESGSHRNPAVLGVWGPDGTRVVAAESMWREPIKWDRAAATAGERHRVFCASLGDVFEDWQGPMVNAAGEYLYDVAGAWIGSPSSPPPGGRPLTMDDVRARLFNLIVSTPNLTWILLTKRPENILDHLDWSGVAAAARSCWTAQRMLALWLEGQPPANVWLGTTCEDQANADRRIPELLGVPAAVRFLSCEPLLSEIDLSNWLFRSDFTCTECGRREYGRDNHGPWGFCECPSDQPDIAMRREGPSISWTIAGGESGPRARPCDLAWIRSIRDQCRAAGVACFIKQLGSVPTVDRFAAADGWPAHVRAEDRAAVPGRLVVRLRDPKGGDWSEWSPGLRVRQSPAPTEVARP